MGLPAVHLHSPSSTTVHSDNDSPPPESSTDRRTLVYINPIYNDGNFTEAQTSEHQLPKWVVHLLQDVKSNE
jgi:hypothetical protein